MKMDWTLVTDGDVDMSWEVPQPANGDFGGLPEDDDFPAFAAAVLTVAERPRDNPEDMDDGDENPMLPAGLYFFIADGLGYSSGSEFYRPCNSIDVAQAYLAELTLERFEANMPDYIYQNKSGEDVNTGPLANSDWIIKLGWVEVAI